MKFRPAKSIFIKKRIPLFISTILRAIYFDGDIGFTLFNSFKMNELIALLTKKIAVYRMTDIRKRREKSEQKRTICKETDS